MLKEIPLNKITPNPFNCRVSYPVETIQKMANSLRENGQLAGVSVRPSRDRKDQYELVFGHRRYFAAKTLGWGSIKAEIVSTTDEQMIANSLIENLEHESLSDYEKALIFERMNKEFGKTYEEIGRMAGINRQHVSNYIAMLRLFDPKKISAQPELIECLGRLTEHHARILLRIDDSATRLDLARKVVRENLSVRELSYLVGRLRSWFVPSEGAKKSHIRPGEPDAAVSIESADPVKETVSDDIKAISNVVLNEFSLPFDRDFRRFKDLHLFGEGFSIFSGFRQADLLYDQIALENERKWFYRIRPRLAVKLKDLRITHLGTSALVTTVACYNSADVKGWKLRGSILLVKKGSNWKILHEHWSRLGAEEGLVTLTS